MPLAVNVALPKAEYSRVFKAHEGIQLQGRAWYTIDPDRWQINRIIDGILRKPFS
jgi:hypothetical protein